MIPLLQTPPTGPTGPSALELVIYGALAAIAGSLPKIIADVCVERQRLQQQKADAEADRKTQLELASRQEQHQKNLAETDKQKEIELAEFRHRQQIELDDRKRQQEKADATEREGKEKAEMANAILTDRSATASSLITNLRRLQTELTHDADFDDDIESIVAEADNAISMRDIDAIEKAIAGLKNTIYNVKGSINSRM